MSDELRELRKATNRKIKELNAFLDEADADVEPVKQIGGWDYDSLKQTSEAGIWIEERTRRVDMLSLPGYVDARAHTTVHQILGYLEQLEAARMEQMESLKAEV